LRARQCHGSARPSDKAAISAMGASSGWAGISATILVVGETKGRGAQTARRPGI
jgi:hypothetical protein